MFLAVKFVLYGYGQIELHVLGFVDLMVRVDQFDPHSVLAGRQPRNVDRVIVTCIRPPPRQIVHSDMQMAGAWRYLGGARSEHWNNAQVLNAVLKKLLDSPECFDMSVAEQIACLSAEVRGFGHVKARAMEAASKRWDELEASLWTLNL